MDRRDFIKYGLFSAIGVPLLASAKINSVEELSEWEKCHRSPHYFINNYVYIPHPTKEKILFCTYGFQNKVLNDYIDHDKNVILTARQMGMSNLSVAYALWEMIFSQQKVLFVTHSRDAAQSVTNNLAFMYANLPDWLKVGFFVYNRTEIGFKNGGSFVASPSYLSSIGGVRGRSFDFAVFDNISYYNDPLDVWLSVYPQVKNGRVAFVSSLYREGDWFHDLVRYRKFVGAHYRTLTWDVHPLRDSDWKRETIRNIGKDCFAMEYECRFL